MAAGRSLIVFTWDGGSLDHLARDAEPDFDILLFDFTGKAAAPGNGWPFLSRACECKGDVLRIMSRQLRQSATVPDYVALFDHDIRVRFSDINRLLEIGRRERLDSFAPALTHDSHYSYARFLQQPGGAVRRTGWVEVMMPFYRGNLFLAASDFYEGSITAYGIDSFVMPLFQKVLGLNNVAVIDSVTTTHMNPVSNGARLCSNGLTPYQERVRTRRDCLTWLDANRPDLVGSPWYYAIFAPWDGPASFWSLRLGWPWHRLKRLLAERSSSRRRARHCSTKAL